MRTLQRLLVIFAFAIAGLFVSSYTLTTPAFACGYFTGYDDCGKGGGGKPLGWDIVNPNREYQPYTKKDPGRNGGIDWGETFKSGNDCKTLCGEGFRQRSYEHTGPLFPKSSYPEWFDYNESCSPGDILRGLC